MSEVRILSGAPKNWIQCAREQKTGREGSTGPPAEPIGKAGNIKGCLPYRGRPKVGQSSQAQPSRFPAGPLAQLEEQLTLNQRVTGSSPVRPTSKIKGVADLGYPPFFLDCGRVRSPFFILKHAAMGSGNLLM